MSDDSISINFSLRQIRVADLITNAQRMLLLSLDTSRYGVRIGHLEKEFSNLRDNTKELLEYAFNPRYVMPPCIFIPRILRFDLDRSCEENGAELSFGFYSKISKEEFPSLEEIKGLKFSLNPFFTLTKVSDLPQLPEDL